ncbi:tRNA(His) guanylyltransferase Thg1 family protein [Sinomonas sp. G460-2]|uniref:tRNA(His) guanylyltransferase Thg1 family protein n=1 Tax=Sinomonas sp. G460-2 TaxID=3393464 RepID=UPI0039EE9452
MSTYVDTEPASVAFKRLEHSYRTHLPANSFAAIRVDGKGFSAYTRRLERPFDAKFSADMQATALYMAEQIQGAVAVYTQSDEISVVLSDLASPETQHWFGGQVQKVVSVTAALATAKFNSLRPESEKLAVFDGRTHHLPGEDGVADYLRWRQEDAMKNSVGMLASHHFSHRQLQGVSVRDRKAMLGGRGIEWGELPQHLRQGTLVRRELRQRTVSYTHKGTGVEHAIDVERREWTAAPAPQFGDYASLELI